MTKKWIFPTIILVTVATYWVAFLKPEITKADTATNAHCGDTISADLTLDGDLDCPSGNGLTVGANNITIDGNGHTITGHGQGVGILYGNANTNVTITGFTITGFAGGVRIVDAEETNLTISNNIISSNINYGISVSSSVGVSFSGNSMSGNGSNFTVTGFSNAQFNHTLTLTNKVEGKTIFYSYGLSTAQFDGDEEDFGIGMFWCIACTDVSIRDATLSENNEKSIYIRGSTGIGLSNLTVSGSTYHGVYIEDSTTVTMSNVSMSDNATNFHVEASDASYYDHNIDATNTIETKSMYYYNGVSDQSYDGDDLEDTNLFWCYDCANVAISDVILDDNDNNGVRIIASNGVALDNVSVSNSQEDGIRIDSSVDVSLQNSASFSNTRYGVYLVNSSTETDSVMIADSDIYSNTNYGIYAMLSDYAVIFQNTIYSNLTGGIYFDSSTHNEITNNTIYDHENGTGISLDFSSSESILSGNKVYNNVIGMSITSANNIISYNRVTSNNSGVDKDNYGISIGKWNNSVINNHIAGNMIGIIAYSEEGETVSILSDNVLADNFLGVKFDNSTGPIALNENLFKHNRKDLEIADGTNDHIYTDNIFYNNGISTMIELDDSVSVSRAKSLGDTINFQFDISDANSASCSTCTYTTVVKPQETVIGLNKTDNSVSGSFTPTKKGTYSLVATAEDSGGNLTTKNYYFLIDSGINTETLYMSDIVPSQGQPRGNGGDSKTLVYLPRDSREVAYCDRWVEFTPDEAPNYPLAVINSVRLQAWYTSKLAGDMGLQRFITDWDVTMDLTTAVDASLNEIITESEEAFLSADPSIYSQSDETISDINWGIDSVTDWYWFAMKFDGGSDAKVAIISYPSVSEISNQSRMIMENQIGINPAIKSISNTDIKILSATATGSDSGGASLILDPVGSDSDSDISNGVDNIGSANIALGGGSHPFRRPFLDYTTTIYSDGTTILQATDISEETTIDAVKMELTPNAGNISVNIDIWETSGAYYKKWTETGVGASSANHVAGDLKSNTKYTVMVDGAVFGTYTSSDTGDITFDYNGGYSSKVFEVFEDATAPTLNVTSPSGDISTSYQSITVSGTSSDAGSGIASLTVNGVSVSSPTNFSTAVNLSFGVNTIVIVVTDNAGNFASQTFSIIKLMPSIALTDPANTTFTTYSSSFLVKGTVSGNEVGVKSLIINGVMQADPSIFSTYVRLMAGINLIDITAIDNADNTVTLRLTVTYMPQSLLTDTVSATDSTSTPTQTGNEGSVKMLSSAGNWVDLSSDFSQTTTINKPTFSGKTVPYAIIYFEIQPDNIIATTIADDEGNWSYTVGESLNNGEHTVKITIKDENYNLISENTYGFTVAGGITPPTGEAEKVSHQSYWIYIIAGAVLILIIIAVVIKRKRR